MKKNTESRKKLRLAKKTLQQLSPAQLDHIAGGGTDTNTIFQCDTNGPVSGIDC